MKTFIAGHPDAKVALEDGVQAVLSGKMTPEAAMARAQQEADGLMKPYVDQPALKRPE